ncbi:unnamed protein product [Ilex paraguariensis]|uniref:Late embryogenesis abundant protein LEA-2 subgroup domain-containing protein n=1 Tax=Ilex paraguariensis TaxID=185542 RepID=A0ABC8UG83_9AQUA
MPDPVLRERHTSLFIWGAVVICAILATVVIITGIVVFVGYIVIRPKMPVVSVKSAHLDNIFYDVASVLTVQISIVIKAENRNTKAHSSFYDTSFILGFSGLEIAKLVAAPFDVRKNSSIEFHYLVESSPIPLNPQEAEVLYFSLRQNRVSFDLRGTTRTRWRLGLLGSVKFWLHLNCQLQFPINGSSIHPHCSTRSK